MDRLELPSRTATAETRAHASGSEDDRSPLVRWSATTRSRFGVAEPIVSAPTRMPMAVPRRTCHHPAAIFDPRGVDASEGNTGYNTKEYR